MTYFVAFIGGRALSDGNRVILFNDRDKARQYAQYLIANNPDYFHYYDVIEVSECVEAIE